MARKYSSKAGEKVEEAMHEMKRGELKSGRSGKKVTSRKQAIAIGLSEARERGAKVPKKAGTKKSASKKSPSKNYTIGRFAVRIFSLLMSGNNTNMTLSILVPS